MGVGTELAAARTESPMSGAGLAAYLELAAEHHPVPALRQVAIDAVICRAAEAKDSEALFGIANNLKYPIKARESAGRQLVQLLIEKGLPESLEELVSGEDWITHEKTDILREVRNAARDGMETAIQNAIPRWILQFRIRDLVEASRNSAFSKKLRAQTRNAAVKATKKFVEVYATSRDYYHNYHIVFDIAGDEELPEKIRQIACRRVDEAARNCLQIGIVHGDRGFIRDAASERMVSMKIRLQAGRTLIQMGMHPGINVETVTELSIVRAAYGNGVLEYNLPAAIRRKAQQIACRIAREQIAKYAGERDQKELHKIATAQNLPPLIRQEANRALRKLAVAAGREMLDADPEMRARYREAVRGKRIGQRGSEKARIQTR